MNYHRTLDDDDSPFDARGILKDGRTARVPLMLRDAALTPLQRQVAAHGMRLHDGHGNHDLVGHRPGYLVSDAHANDAREEARAKYENELQNAWRIGDKKVTQRDPSGRLMATFEEEPDDDELYDASTLTLDEVIRDHQERMAEVYTAYDKALGERWRQP